MQKLWLIPVAVLLVGAKPFPEKQTLQQAGSAHASEDYSAALTLYAKAESRATDPGFVAYNKAIALYQLSHQESRPLQRARYLQQAMAHFRFCEEDPDIERQARAWYGRGNCLIRLGSDSTSSVEEAIRCYRKCIQLTKDKDLLDSTRHNIELARLLWLQAKESETNDPDKHPDEQPDENPGSNNPRKDPGEDPDQNPNGTNPDQGAKKGSVEKREGKKPIPTDQAPPAGKGQKAPVKDDEALQQISPEDAREQLNQAAQRILQERRAYRYRAAKQAMGSVRDW